jgi:hypothetical protein
MCENGEMLVARRMIIEIVSVDFRGNFDFQRKQKKDTYGGRYGFQVSS